MNNPRRIGRIAWEIANMPAFILTSFLFFAAAFALIAPMSAYSTACLFAAAVMLVGAPLVAGLWALADR